LPPSATGCVRYTERKASDGLQLVRSGTAHSRSRSEPCRRHAAERESGAAGSRSVINSNSAVLHPRARDCDGEDEDYEDFFAGGDRKQRTPRMREEIIWLAEKRRVCSGAALA
jgi:hypothetical protein